MEAVDIQQEMRSVPIGAVHPAPYNGRAKMNETEIADLTESVKASGILQPLIVRVVERSLVDSPYELVAGHRRLEAAKRAGLRELPVVVRVMTDEQAEEVQLVENLQRADLNPLDEAESYHRLSRRPSYDIAKIAARVGRPVGYVYDRLKLLSLIKPAQELFRSGRIQTGHAIVLARLTAKDQSRALEAGESGRSALFEPEHTLFDPAESTGADPLKVRSVAELQAWVDEHVRFAEKAADPMLFPETAEELSRAKKVIPITRSHFLADDARDGHTFGPKSWKRADGRKGSKPCEHAVTGLVVAGPGRGEAFAICVEKKKCRVHWETELKASVQAKKERAARAPGAPDAAEAPVAAMDPGLTEALDQARDAAEAKTLELLLDRAQAMTSIALIRALLYADPRPLGEYLTDHLGPQLRGHLGMHGWIRKTSPKQLHRALAFWFYNESSGPTNLLEQALGVDGDRIMKEFERQARAEFKAGLKAGAKSDAPPAPVKPTQRGVCRVCGCTEKTPCPEGCGWTDKSRTLCTSCDPSLAVPVVKAKEGPEPARRKATKLKPRARAKKPTTRTRSRR